MYKSKDFYSNKDGCHNETSKQYAEFIVAKTHSLNISLADQRACTSLLAL